MSFVSQCPNCGSRRVFYDSHTGELKCCDCGYVVEEGIVDGGPEWRAYSSEQAVARARAEPVKPFSRMSTVIGETHLASASRRAEFRRLALIQSQMGRCDSRSVIEGHEEIKRLSAALKAPSQVREEALRLFTIAQKRGLLRGRSVSSIAVACMMVACREYGVPCQPGKLCELTSVSRREARRCYLLIVNRLRDKLSLKPPNPLRYIPMIASKLELSMDVQKTAVKLVKAASEAHILLGKPPRSVAAASLYIAAITHSEKRVRSLFAEAIGVTETTLRKRAKELLRKLDVIVYV